MCSWIDTEPRVEKSTQLNSNFGAHELTLLWFLGHNEERSFKSALIETQFCQHFVTVADTQTTLLNEQEAFRLIAGNGKTTEHFQAPSWISILPCRSFNCF